MDHAYLSAPNSGAITPSPAAASGLPDDVRDLLQAVVDALSIPRPAPTERDMAAHDVLIDRRASDVRVMLEVLLAHPATAAPARSARRLREWTADSPATYAPWQDGGQR